MKTIERAAIRSADGHVYAVQRPGRHDAVIHFMDESGVPWPVTQGAEQGFMTSDWEFVGRERAMEIAKEAGQLLPDANPNAKILFSEDVW